jgi:hypothetical protein
MKLLKSARGDGNRYVRDMNQMLVGKTVARVEPDVARVEGEDGDLSVVRIHFEDGDSLLVVPQRVEPMVKAQTGLDVAIRFTLFPKGGPGLARNQNRILLPGRDF